MKLHLGFERFPYAERFRATSPLTKAVKAKARLHRQTPSQKSYGQGKTTLEVAKELEEKYGIVEKFVELEDDLISNLMEDAYDNAFENIEKYTKRGTITNKDTAKIEAKFRQNLARKRYDGIISGVPTLASIRGVSHLQSKPYAKRSPRPSFIDTGMYQRSFRAWLEDD